MSTTITTTKTMTTTAAIVAPTIIPVDDFELSSTDDG